METVNINWFPGHMAKTIKEIKEKINLVDMVIELCDARVVYSSCNPIVSELIKNKCYMKVCSKKDLADDVVSASFEDRYKKQNIECIFVDLKNKESLKPIVNKIKEVSKPIIEKDLRRGLKPRNVRVMVIGIPNVGKSTLINLLAKRKSAPVGNTPGFTKSLKWVKCDGFDLLDTPGLLWPNLSENNAGVKLALAGCINERILPSIDLCKIALEYLNENYHDMLLNKYQIEFTNVDNYLENFSKSKCHLLKDNELDYERSALLLLNDLKNGKIGKISLER